MNHKLFLQYLRQYTLQALERAGDDPSLAADSVSYTHLTLPTNREV